MGEVSLVLVLMRNFNLPDVLWNCKNTAEEKQSRRFLDCVEENFHSILLEKPTAHGWDGCALCWVKTGCGAVPREWSHIQLPDRHQGCSPGLSFGPVLFYEEWLREMGVFSLEKRQLRLSTKRRLQQDGSWTFLLTGNHIKLCLAIFRFGSRKNFLITKVVKCWNKYWLPREVVESQSLDPMSLGDVV